MINQFISHIINHISIHIIYQIKSNNISNIYSHFKEIDGPVMDEVAAPFEPTLIYSLRKTAYLNIYTWEGLPTWISEAAKRAICRSITNAMATNILHWTTPVLVATQLKMNLGWLPGMVLLGTATTVAVPSIFTGILRCDRLVHNSIMFS